MPGPYIAATPVAQAVPFDNATNGFASTDVQAAIEESKTSTGTTLTLFGDGSDGDVTLSSGTTTLTRTMFYNSLTLSGTAVVDVNGFGVFVRNTCSLSGSSSIISRSAAGSNASGATAGAQGTAPSSVDVGPSNSGTAGGAGGAINAVGTAATSFNSNLAIIGGPGGQGGTGGTGAGPHLGGAGGGLSTFSLRPLRTILNTTGISADIRQRTGGHGGSGGGGGGGSTTAAGGGGGGGGSSGGMVVIYAKTFSNTSLVGLQALGGNGGNGAQGGLNAGGGAGGGGGGGGYIFVVAQTVTAAGILTVTKGSGGLGGLLNGTGAAGAAGADGADGHSAVYQLSTDTWALV